MAEPFINAASPAVDSVEPSVVTTAMPWLNNDEQSDDGHDQTLSIEINAVTEPEPETEPQPISEQELSLDPNLNQAVNSARRQRLKP